MVEECSEHHNALQSLIRYNRAEIIRELAWKVGLLHELPRDIKEKFCDSEEQYFKDHSKSLKTCMSQLSLDVNVITMAKESCWFSQDMVPPKDPYIKGSMEELTS